MRNFQDEEIRNDFYECNLVAINLNSVDSANFSKINKCPESINRIAVLEGIKEFRKNFTGKMGIYTMLVSRKEKNKFNLEQKRREIFADNIRKRLIATLRDTRLNYICQGVMKPTIYTRYSGLFLVCIKNIWDFDYEEVVCKNGNMKPNNSRASIRVCFEGANVWNGGLIEITPENIVYSQDFAAVEYFFEKIRNYIDKHDANYTEGVKDGK